MNYLNCVLLFVGIGLCTAPTTAWSQPTPTNPQAAAPAAPPVVVLPKTTLPDTLKMAATIDSAAEAQIEAAVAQTIKRMLEDNGDVRRAARDVLYRDARPNAGDASAAFKAKYAEAVNRAVTSMAGQAPVPARVNMALAIARVAEATHSPELQPVLLSLLDDKHYAVRLSAMKAAQFVLPDLIKAKKADRLVAKVVQVAAANPTGAMTAEAYDALMVEPAMTDKSFLESILQLMEKRVALYKQGLPEDPGIEARPFNYLTQPLIWNNGSLLAPPQQVRVMQLAANLLAFSAQQADAADRTGSTREQLQSVLKGVSASLFVIASGKGQPELAAASQQLNRVSDSSSTNLSMQVKPVIVEIRKSRGFEAVVEPQLPSAPNTSPVAAQ